MVVLVLVEITILDERGVSLLVVIVELLCVSGDELED